MDGRIVRRRLGALAMLVIAAGCSSGPESGAVPSPDTGPSADLAPSQLTAETAPAPDVPPPCDPGLVTIWTAQVVVVDRSADAVLRVRNDGDTRCEVDVGASPLVDPLMEPDVWLDPGAWADLVLGPDGEGCADAATVTLAQLDVNGERVVVETAAVVPCGWRFTAFYPNEVSDLPCAEIDAVVVDGAVLVRNAGVSTCRLGELVDAAGDSVSVASLDRDATVSVPMLAPGDVVGVDLERRGERASAQPVALLFDSGVTVDVAVDADTAVVDAGPPRPWIGGAGSPSEDDPAGLLAALDPFGAGA